MLLGSSQHYEAMSSFPEGYMLVYTSNNYKLYKAILVETDDCFISRQ